MSQRHANPYLLLPPPPAASSGSALLRPGAGRAASELPVPTQVRPERHCPLCGLPVGAWIQPDSRCPACHSPLADPPALGTQFNGLPGRRGAVRRDQNHVALLHLGWPSVAQPVRWRDLSLTGLGVYSAQPVAIGQRLRLIDSALEVVAEVVDCRAQGRVFAVHARLLTALLLQSTGVFVSTQA